MPTPEITPGSPCWIDLMTSDPERARAFYAALFDWTYEVGDQEKYGGYTMAFKDGKQVAGLMANDGSSGQPDVWTTYLRVEDVDATVAAAAAHGGQVHMPPMVVSEQGKMALIADPSGAAVGLWQFAEHTGFQVHLEPGTPYWHELQATNYEETVRFYQDVLGWETSVMSDSPDFRYTTLGAGRASKAGIMDATSFLTEDYRPAWHLYLGVEDADAAIATARDMGASVLDPAADTPFGRIATLADPTGARFKIAQGTPQG